MRTFLSSTFAASKLRFISPRKTIATAQNLYHRFHLFFPRKDFNYHVSLHGLAEFDLTYGARQDVSLASLYVSTKMHDTLKKPRELLAVSYAIRFPELAAKSKHPGGEVDLDSMDAQVRASIQRFLFMVLSFVQVVEHDRQRLLAVERLLLETICFNFTSRMPFPYVIKVGRAVGGECFNPTFHFPRRSISSRNSDKKVDKAVLAPGYRLVRLNYICLSMSRNT